MNIVLATLNPTVGDLAGNRDKILAVLRGVAPETDLVVFPELSLCGYSPEDLVLKPFFLDRVDEALRELAAASGKIGPAFIVGAPHRQDGHRFNALHLIGGGRVIGTVCKTHLPNYGVFDEARVFTAAPVTRPLELKGRRLGLMICEDMWYPDVAQNLKQQGAEILIVINASPFDVRKTCLRRAQAEARVAETGLPLLYVNQVGGQDELVYDGGAFVLSAGGATVAESSYFAEDALVLRWTPKEIVVEGAPRAPPPDEMETIYRAVLLGLHDYVTKNNFPGVILGLSGGVDSALAAVLAVDALGPERVQAVMMPSRFTARQSLRDARMLTKNLGIDCDKISIERSVSAFARILTPLLGGPPAGLVHENLQPRTRGIILMALSNASGRMVLSTGNKSEVAAGYATLYGDMCGGFNPIKDLYKTQVYALCAWRNKHKPAGAYGPAGKVIQNAILTRAPTAELREDQTDQDTLPPYDVLDAILTGLIEQELSIEEIAAQGYDPATIKRVWQMLDRAEYKRRQAAPGVKITAKSFGRDRRYPITNHFTAP